MPVSPNALMYGDNLDVLRRSVASESVDLVYLDPPFNSNRNYNVIFARQASSSDTAQIQAFDDTWRWTQATEEQFTELINGGVPNAVADALRAMHALLGENDALAYIINMTPRLVELHRVLKRTGSLYLHCDPTMSHYLKVMLDAIFGARYFRGEITWLRTTTHNDAKRWSPNADIILYYAKSDAFTWNPVHTAHTDRYVQSKYRHDDGDGRLYRLDNMTSPNPRPNLTYEWMGHEPPANGWRYSRERMAELHEAGRIWYPDEKAKRPQLKRYLEEQLGTVVGNVWTDIPPLNSQAAERLGYPTQKPVALMDRIIRASSNRGDVVLDPFCGCGTTVDSAIKLDRRWLGIDVTYIAVGLIQARLKDTYGDGIAKTYRVEGIPRDLPGAQALFNASPFDFERWAVTLAEGTPNEKQVGDRGIDGVIRFLNDKSGKAAGGRVLVSVKGGKSINPGMLRDLVGTVESQKAEMGLLITMVPATPGVVEAASHSGTYVWPVNGAKFPKVQVITVPELLNFQRPKMPPPLTPYISAVRRPNAKPDQPSIFDVSGSDEL